MTNATGAVVWGDGARAELSWSESLNLGNYTIEAEDFSAPEGEPVRVLLKIYQEGRHLTSKVLKAGEGFSINDSLKAVAEQVIAEDLRINRSYVKVMMQIPAVPEISLALIPDKDAYFGGEVIRLDLRVENTGLVDAESLKIIVESKDLARSEMLSKGRLKPGEMWKEDEKLPAIKLMAPYLLEPGEVSILAAASSSDSEGGQHQSQAAAAFKVSGPLQLHKRVEENQWLGKQYYVINSLRNTGNFTIKTRLTDSAGANFKAKSPLAWELELCPGETEIQSYVLEPKKPGAGLVLPAAKASFSWEGKIYEVSSEGPVIDVAGPLIEVRRKADPQKVMQGQQVEVILDIKNEGNRHAGVDLKQELPQGAELVAGSLSQSFGLMPGEKRTTSYRLKCLHEGILKIPDLSVRYRNVQGNEFEENCPALSIQVEAEDEIEEKESSASSEPVIDNEQKAEEEEKNAQAPMHILLLIILVLSIGLSRYP